MPGGSGSDAGDLGLVGCDRTTALLYGSGSETVFVVFVAEGATARIDGAEPDDQLYDPNLMGNWILVSAREGHRRRVVITGPSGRRLSAFTLSHSDADAD